MAQILDGKKVDSWETIFDTASAMGSGDTLAIGKQGNKTGSNSASLARLLLKKPMLFSKMLQEHMRRKNRGSAEKSTEAGHPDACFWVEHTSLIADRTVNATWAW